MPEICLPNVYLKPSLERRIQNRLKRIEGQIRGIQRLTTEHHSCDDILIQIGAVKQAINGVAVELLEGHTDTCVAESVEKGQGRKVLASLKGALAHVLRQGA
ncbi:MAG: metal-sensitive transcriptional regulator [Gemmatimonadetes bacterium]|nr:metal-sensitive transcriptional regulator [Gemmatimonadota bacterium]